MVIFSIMNWMAADRWNGDVPNAALGDVGVAAVICIAVLGILSVSVTRAVTVRMRPLIAAGAAARVVVVHDGIWVPGEEGLVLRPWEKFTALLITDHTYVVTQISGYLPIPKRAVGEGERRAFEIFVRGMCLKQGPSNDFPVIFEPQPARAGGDAAARHAGQADHSAESRLRD
jgi:hypothetical protein